MYLHFLNLFTCFRSRSASKIMVLGSDYLKYVETDISLSSLPPFLGGPRQIGHIPFCFDSSEDGLLKDYSPKENISG